MKKCQMNQPPQQQLHAPAAENKKVRHTLQRCSVTHKAPAHPLVVVIIGAAASRGSGAAAARGNRPGKSKKASKGQSFRSSCSKERSKSAWAPLTALFLCWSFLLQTSRPLHYRSWPISWQKASSNTIPLSRFASVSSAVSDSTDSGFGM